MRRGVEVQERRPAGRIGRRPGDPVEEEEEEQGEKRRPARRQKTFIWCAKDMRKRRENALINSKPHQSGC